MPGEVSCRALRPLFRYLRERGLGLGELIAGLHGEGRDIFSPDGSPRRNSATSWTVPPR
jgi:hypothetical protein